MALDTSDHLWIAVETSGDNGAVIELDPDTNNVISTIGNIAHTCRHSTYYPTCYKREIMSC